MTGVLLLWLTSISRLRTLGRSPHRDRVGGATNRLTTTIQNMRINHCRGHIVVAKQFLHGSYVIAVLQEMGCERMTERVRPGRFGNACFQPRLFDGLLEDRFVKVMPGFFSSIGIRVVTRRRK